VLKFVILATLATATAAQAFPCAHKDGPLTSRVMVVDPQTYPRVGLASFPETLPLQDKEVVLTFDDGPNPPTTTKIMAALEQECARATFFMVGQNARAHSALVRRIAAAGHTVAHHTWAHPNLGLIGYAAALDQIDRGITADDTALYGSPGTQPAVPFFRFPYFQSTPALLDDLQKRGITVFGTDMWASDWVKMSPAQELKLITGRLAAKGRGIILFHDTKAQTAAIIPDFLRYLRSNGYRVVHVVPATTSAGTRTPLR
jgi:peptidoglycan/xylan/chitin deacetylase (PgdA/CDA1 family)